LRQRLLHLRLEALSQRVRIGGCDLRRQNRDHLSRRIDPENHACSHSLSWSDSIDQCARAGACPALAAGMRLDRGFVFCRMRWNRERVVCGCANQLNSLRGRSMLLLFPE
jgi:hypothetical protein